MPTDAAEVPHYARHEWCMCCDASGDCLCVKCGHPQYFDGEDGYAEQQIEMCPGRRKTP